jgi:hypothetical protein
MEVTRKKNPNQVYVYASLETPGAFGKDLMNENLLSQVDYIAHSNEKASSLWLPQMISTRGLMASYEAFSRPKNTRIPGVAWLGKNCPDNAPKLKVLKEVSNHFPVFSIGDCRRNTATPLGLPEHKLMGSGGIDFFTKTQLALSDYLFYFVGEDADCPGAIHADLWMALARGSIPVYFGTANVYEYLPCPDGDCIIDVKKFDSSKHLAKELRKISSSQKLYKKATEWRRQHPDEWPEGFKRGLARASQDFRKTLCDSVLQNGGDQFDKGVTKEDVIKRTIMSVPWSDVASSSSSSSSSQVGIPGLYVTEDPGAADEAAKFGNLSLRLGLGWSKSNTFTTGQCPVMKYNHSLMMAILYDKVNIADAVNAKIISLDAAPSGYKDFDKGAATKFVIDPHNYTGLC